MSLFYVGRLEMVPMSTAGNVDVIKVEGQLRNVRVPLKFLIQMMWQRSQIVDMVSPISHICCISVTQAKVYAEDEETTVLLQRRRKGQEEDEEEEGSRRM